MDNRYRILIVDDDRCITESLKQWFEMNGYLATTAVAADEILWLSLWQWQCFNCIITGINQPGLNGLEFTKLVRNSSGPPVIVISGYKPEVARAKALESGADAFLKKPFNFEEILRIVDDCCNENR